MSSRITLSGAPPERASLEESAGDIEGSGCRRASELIDDGQAAQLLLGLLEIGDVLEEHLDHRIALPRQSARDELDVQRAAVGAADLGLLVLHRSVAERTVELGADLLELLRRNEVEKMLPDRVDLADFEQAAGLLVGEQDPLLRVDQQSHRHNVEHHAHAFLRIDQRLLGERGRVEAVMIVEEIEVVCSHAAQLRFARPIVGAPGAGSFSPSRPYRAGVNKR